MDAAEPREKGRSLIALWVAAAVILTIGGIAVAAKMGDDAEAPRRRALPAGSLEAKASFVVDQLAAGKFEDARADFDDNLLANMPPDRLRRSWETTVARYGGFAGQGDPNVLDRGNGIHVVDVPVRFARSVRKVRVTYDSNGRIAGFFIRPVDAP